MGIYNEHLLPMIGKTVEVIENTPHMQDILYGRLPLVKFRFQIKQNYQYLMEYTKCFALGLSKCHGFDEMYDWYKILSSTMEGTVILNRDYWAKQIGLTIEEMEKTIMAEGKRSYTSHELARAMEGDLASALMAVFPCNILYMHMGRDLLPVCTLPEDNIYRKWIEFYTLPEYVKKCENEIRMIDKYSNNKSNEEIKRLLEIFAVGCNYEILQWKNMYYNMETWPLMDIFPDNSII